MTSIFTHTVSVSAFRTIILVALLTFAIPFLSYAATLSLSPSSGVYGAGETFTARVVVNTNGAPINAADATLSFNPNELSVVSVNRGSSIFNLWVTEPEFSNSAGSIAFSGGLPSGYTGSAGNVMNVTFRSKGSGTARVSFTNGSVLANDGRGTNVLTAMNGGTYTIQAASSAPEPEVIEYVAPANTPAAPAVQSSTHPDPSKWYNADTATLSWSVPSDITAVRTLLNTNPTSVPTKVYEDPISTITLADLGEGESYFHIQFQNADGWGRVTHYRLGVDTENPENIKITHADDADLSNPVQTLRVQVDDETSLVNQYAVKIDDAEPFNEIDETGSGTIQLPPLDPGYHSVIIEAFDQAGNSVVGTYSFTIEAFEKPVFTEYPTEMNEGVIPVIKGMTRPNSTVTITLEKVGSEPVYYDVISDESGEFIFIPEGTFARGVYELSAVAVDEYDAKSELSDVARIAVQEPGYIRIGGYIVSVLSVVIPLVTLVVAFFFGLWYLVFAFRRFRKRVRVESTEALEILHREFASLQSTLRSEEHELQNSRKSKKLTKAEANMIEVFDRSLQESQQRVEKEIEDVTELTNKNTQ